MFFFLKFLICLHFIIQRFVPSLFSLNFLWTIWKLRCLLSLQFFYRSFRFISKQFFFSIQIVLFLKTFLDPLFLLFIYLIYFAIWSLSHHIQTTLNAQIVCTNYLQREIPVEARDQIHKIQIVQIDSCLPGIHLPESFHLKITNKRRRKCLVGKRWKRAASSKLKAI